MDFRMIHPAASGADTLLSRLGRGPPDEMGRPTFQNHIAIVPVELLESGRVSFASVDAAIGLYEETNPGAVGELGPLEVGPPPHGYKVGLGLRQHVTRAAIETVATRRLADHEARTLLICRETLPTTRNEILFRIIELLNIVAGVDSFTAMSDAPTASALNTFNLVVAPRGVRGDNSWAIVDAASEQALLKRVPDCEQIYEVIEHAFAADAATYA